jgi:hypothetical protein
MRPVILGAILGFLLSAVFAFYNPGEGNWPTVVGLGIVLGALLAFLMVNVMLPYLNGDALFVWIISVLVIVLGVYVVFFNTAWFGVDTHFPLGAGLITGGFATILYFTETFTES